MSAVSSSCSRDSEEDTLQTLTDGTSEISSAIVPPYKCDSCDFSTNSAQGLISHKNQHLLKCFLCIFSSSSLSEFTEHLKLEHAAELDLIRSQSSVNTDYDIDQIPCAVCQLCDFMTYSVVVLERHMDLKHPETKASAKPNLRFIAKSAGEEVRQSDIAFNLLEMCDAPQTKGNSETGSVSNVSDVIENESPEDMKPDVTDMLTKSSTEEKAPEFNPDLFIRIKTEPIEAEVDENVSNECSINQGSPSSPPSSDEFGEQEPCSVVFPITTNEGETVLIQSSVQNLVSEHNHVAGNSANKSISEDSSSLFNTGKRKKGKKSLKEDTGSGKSSAKHCRQNKSGRSTKKIKDIHIISTDILTQQTEEHDDCSCPICDLTFSSKLLLEIHQRKWHIDVLRKDSGSLNTVTNGLRNDTDSGSLNTVTNGLRNDTDLGRNGEGTTVKEEVESESSSDLIPKENFPETERQAGEEQFGSEESNMVVGIMGTSETDYGLGQNSSLLGNKPGEKYRGNVNFWKHLMMTQTGIKLLPCDMCGKGFGDHIALSKHLKTHTGEKPFKCHVCEKRFRDGSYLQVHLRTHTGEKPFKCGECDKSFSRGGHLLLHMRTHTGEKPFACGECGKSFIRNDLLHAHMRTHTEENPFKCDLCGKTFSDSNSVKRHARTHSGEKPFPCKECGKCFARTELLNVHMRVHTGEKPYRCEMCDKRFGNNSNLQIHIRTHTGEKPFQCKLCGKHFRRSGQLHIHMRSHTGEKPYKCEECGKGISSKDQLQIHMRTHTGEKPYACTECDKSFCRNGQLQIHLRMHTGEKPFQCNQCPKGFRDRSSLNRHLKIHEREEVK